MRLNWVALNHHPLILSPLPVPSIDLSMPSPQVLANDLCVNFINDCEDDSEYDPEDGSDNNKTDFTRNTLIYLMLRRMMIHDFANDIFVCNCSYLIYQKKLLCLNLT